MKQSFTFNTSVIASTASTYDAGAFDLSIEAYENKEYMKSLHILLDAIHKDIRKKYGNDSGNEFYIPHGPLYIHIRIDEEKINITCPFVELPEKNPIAMMREAAGINFNDLDLSRLKLKDGRLCFEYSSPLAFSHPRKIYHVLSEICRIGGKYDYDFCHTFQASRSSDPFFTAYDEKTVSYIYEAVRKICRECLDALNYYESSRKFNDMWNIIAGTLLRIVYVAHPRGEMFHTMQKAIRDMDRDIPTSIVVASGKQTIQELYEKSREEWSESLYFIETFISSKKRSNLQNIRENYEKCYKQVSVYMASGEYRSVCFRILYKFYETYYQNQMQHDLDHLLTEAMKKAASLPWKEAATVLYETLEKIIHSPLHKGHLPSIAA